MRAFSEGETAAHPSFVNKEKLQFSLTSGI
jgi:hypothetical protein